MVQLAEGGAIGTSIFLFFYLWILLNLIKFYKKHSELKKIALVLLGGFIAILFINITAWTYSYSHYFVCFGIIVGYLKMPIYNKANLVYTKVHLN
mgnify:CR=1 FL=1